MRTRLLTVASLALVLLALALPARAAGAETLHVKFKGQTAQAEFSSTEGCVETTAYVLASVGEFKTDSGGREWGSAGEVYLFQSDLCTQTQLLGGYGIEMLMPGEFQIDEEFTEATLNTTIEVTDRVAGRTIPLNVSVAWDGYGGTFSDDTRFHEDSPELRVNFHLAGTFRQATASGTVTDGTTNFTPEPAVTGYGTRLGSIKVGEVDIINQ